MVAAWLGITAAYLLPVFIACARPVRNFGSILVIDLFLGWTGIGWIVALAMAVRSTEPQAVQVWQPPADGAMQGWQLGRGRRN